MNALERNDAPLPDELAWQSSGSLDLGFELSVGNAITHADRSMRSRRGGIERSELTQHWLDSQARIEDSLGVVNILRTEVSACTPLVFYAGKAIPGR